MLAFMLLLMVAAPPSKADAGAEPWKTTPMPGPMPEAKEHGLADVNGVTLYWASYGSGEPLFLLHGGAGNGDHWALEVPGLSQNHTVYVVDSRGHGRSTRPAGALTYGQMADDLVALMNVLKISKAAVVGWSDGGAVVLELATRHADRVTKVVAYATNYHLAGMKSGGGATFSAYFALCKKDYARLSPTPKDYEGLLKALRPMWHSAPNFTDAQMAAIEVPLLVLDGEHDEIIKQDHVRTLAQLVPGAKLVLIPDASHFALFQQPAAFNQAVLDFLDAPK